MGRKLLTGEFVIEYRWFVEDLPDEHAAALADFALFKAHTLVEHGYREGELQCQLEKDGKIYDYKGWWRFHHDTNHAQKIETASVPG